jgi:uncharacterized OB-fold protein
VTRPIPVLRGEEKLYFEHAGRGELIFQTCAHCGHRQWYPRVLCTECASTNLITTVSAGRGSIYSFTTLYRAGHPSRAQDVPYTIALVELDEGVRVFTEIVGMAPEEITVGERVVVDFQVLAEGFTLPMFTREVA